MGWLDFLKRKQTIPFSFVQEYEKLFPAKISKGMSFSQLDFVVLDTETTGLNTSSDFIISFGSVRVSGYTIKIKKAKELYLKPKKLGREAIKIHGLIKSEGPLPLENFIKEVLQEIGNLPLVAHHAGFDKAMLEKAGKPFGLTKLRNFFLDTMDLAIRLEIGRNYNPHLVNLADYSLDSLCKRYHIALDDRHTASGDAFLTAQLLLKLLKVAERKGIKTFGDLMQM
jgi:DNA polymerase-3 subunit epsilon